MRSLLKLLPYMKPYRSRYAFGLFLVLIGVMLAVISPLVIKAAIDGLQKGDLARPIFHFSLALLLIGLARGVLMFKGRFTLIAASRSIEYDIRSALYRKLLSLPPSFFDRSATGDLESRVINDVEGIRMVCGIAIMLSLSSGLMTVLSLVAMFSIDATLASLSIVPLGLISLFTSLLTKRIYQESEIVQKRLAEMTTVAQENFTGVRVVRAFVQEETEVDKFRAAARAYVNANLKLSLTRGATWGMMTLLIEAGVGVVLLVGGLGILNGRLTLGEFTAFTAYQFMLSWPVIAMGWVITLIQRGAACIDRISLILEEPEEEVLGSASRNTPPKKGEIVIKNLTFRYTKDRLPALKDLSLTIRAGERVAIVGRTGAGKSTLLQLLLGHYRPDNGTIFLDDHDVNDYTRRALREEIGIVPQDAFLFSDSLAANIKFGAKSEVSSDALDRAVESSRLAADLTQFPQGLEQIVGERGITLSGGQKQRTAIARAFIREPRILLLDDALASVDVHTENEILERLDEHLNGRSCLIVTHRFSIVSKVDRILVLDEGKLVEEGRHDDLVNAGGLYAQLVKRQQLEESLKLG
ncbi:MAG: multidrug ABC transporter ATP-binding protein [Elusimicrobia bacterium]|nr:MAG: multidrug ABC transporter ATP-binding protein [Elusimicrobiota bacterium]